MRKITEMLQPKLKIMMNFTKNNIQIEIPEQNAQVKYISTLWIKNHCGYTQRFWPIRLLLHKVITVKSLKSE